MNMMELLSLVPRMSLSLLSTFVSPTFQNLPYMSLPRPAHFGNHTLLLMMNSSMSCAIHWPNCSNLVTSLFLTMAMTMSRLLGRNYCCEIISSCIPTLTRSFSLPETPNGFEYLLCQMKTLTLMLVFPSDIKVLLVPTPLSANFPHASWK